MTEQRLKEIEALCRTLVPELVAEVRRAQQAAYAAARYGVLVTRGLVDADQKAEADYFRQLLRRYGDHRWKCAITRYLRAGALGESAECDCGWKQAQERLEREEYGP